MALFLPLSSLPAQLLPPLALLFLKLPLLILKIGSRDRVEKKLPAPLVYGRKRERSCRLLVSLPVSKERTGPLRRSSAFEVGVKRWVPENVPVTGV